MKRNTKNTFRKLFFVFLCSSLHGFDVAAATTDTYFNTQAFNSKASPAINAAKIVAEESPACKKIAPFYFEIGNADAAIGFLSVGHFPPKAETVMPIASATKWIFGAYVAQKQNGNLSNAAIQALNMTSGYTDLKHSSCIRLLPSRRKQQTVNDCWNAGKKTQLETKHLGKFFYNSGHFQKFAAVDLKLGDKNNEQLAQELKSVLAMDFDFHFESPILASGISTSAKEYAKFLRALLKTKLLLGKMLGDHAVCTAPRTCPKALSTPIPEEFDWHYALGYWIETDPQNGDGAFSSAGALGFYPWIDAHQHFYGIIARKQYSESAAINSVLCGTEIRKAFFANLPQELRQ